jgi:HPt (histidine-containing phosphotransfer) domain-containing protein
MQDMAPGSDEVPLIDERVLQEWRSDLDAEDVQAILDQVPAECGRCIAEIEQAIAQDGLAAARRASHRLKGMAGNLGAARLSRLARGIELDSTSIGDVAARMPRLHTTLGETLARLRCAA